MIRLLAIDMDGTLFNSQSEVSTGNRQAIARAMAEGIEVVIATGKPYGGIERLAAELGLTAPQVTLNGGAVVAPDTRRIISAHPMSEVQYQAILARLTERGIPCVVYTPEQLYCRQWSREIDFLLEIREPRPVVLPELERLSGVVKVLTFVERGDHTQEQLIRGLTVPGVRVIRTSDKLLEYIDERANKGVALRRLADHLGIKIDEVAAIGDSENDLEMLKTAGLGIAMGNAVDTVKGAARWVVADNDHDGVAGAVGRILNEGER